MVDFNSPWEYLSKDWNNTLKFIVLGAALFLIPIIGVWAVTGLTVKIISSVIKKNEEIPDVFEDFWDNVLNGLKLSVFHFIIGIISIIIIVLPVISDITTILSMDNIIMGMENMIMGVIFSSLGLMILLTLAIFLITTILLPGLTCNFAEKKKFSALFDFKKSYSLVSSNWGAFFMMLLVNFVYGLSISLLGSLLSVTVIGTILVYPAIILVNSKVIGDWYLEANGNQ